MPTIIHDVDSLTVSSSSSSSSASLVTVSTDTDSSSASSFAPLLARHAHMTPPRTVRIEPEPLPYAQLCFNQDQGALMALLVGSTRGQRFPYTLLCTDQTLNQVVSTDGSSSSSSADSSTGWSTGSSSSSSSSNDTAELWVDKSMPNVFWLDGSWLYDESSEYSDTHRALLNNTGSSTSCRDNSACSKLLRTVNLRKALKYKSRSGIFNSSHSQLRKSKALSRSKNHRYSTLMA